MANNGPDMETALGPDEDALSRQLAALGPLMAEQERVEAEAPDPVFASQLRARLVGIEAGAREPRARLSVRAGKPAGRRRLAGLGLALAALVGVLAALAVALFPRPTTPSFALEVPFPTRADLIFSYPAPPVVIHRLTPTLSLVHPAPGVPYAGRLLLHAAKLPMRAPTLHAYRLAAVGGIARLGHLLAIRSPIRQIFSQGVKWLVAADGGYPSRRPLHSLAVSLQTGELIYHDRRNTRLPSSRGPLDRSAAVAAARLWLTRLGWPGARMPLLSFRNVATAPKVRKVVFGWLQVGPVATPGATLWVTPDHSIIEAWVWPPVTRAGTIPARSILAAWDDLRAGRLPLAVEGMSPGTSAGGSGSVQRVSVVSILAPSADRHLYLVPTYRFEGSALFQGSATSHHWYALAPGGQK